ncbi:hypothetical protein DMENIID0001_156700 [Sergentomyia squamirostris]
MRILILVSLTIVASVIRLVNSQSSCGICESSSSGISCVSETQFRICSNGILDETTLFECPSGMFCTTSAPFFCDSGSSALEPTCKICNICSANSMFPFACVDETTVALCLDGLYPSNITINCPTGSVCDINAVPPNFCSPNDGTIVICSSTDATTTISSTSATETTTVSSTTVTTSTAASTTTTQSPASWCTEKSTIGRFPDPLDPLCTNYYYCFTNGSSIMGSIYTCPGITVFNPITQLCVLSTSYTCPMVTSTTPVL